MSCRCSDTQARSEQLGHPLVQIGVHRPALVLTGGFGLLDALGLAFAPLLVSLRAMAAIISTSSELIAFSIRLVNSSFFVSCIP